MLRLKRGQHTVESRQRTMPVRIIAQTNDIIVHLRAKRIIECSNICRTAHLCLNDNLCVRANFLASPYSGLQVLHEIGERTSTIVCARRIAVACRPQHTVSNLIARLYEVRLSAIGYQMLQATLCILIHAVGKNIRVGRVPRHRSGMLPRVCPRVTVMEVKHESLPGILNPLAKPCYIVEILVYALILVLT